MLFVEASVANSADRVPRFLLPKDLAPTKLDLINLLIIQGLFVVAISPLSKCSAVLHDAVEDETISEIPLTKDDQSLSTATLLPSFLNAKEMHIKNIKSCLVYWN